jgi:hypothetical protein
LSNVTVRPLAGKADLDRFIRLPHELYRDDPLWVAPLDGDLRAALTPGRSPFWLHARRELLLAELDGKVVGRVAAIVDDNYNEHNRHRRAKTAFFGWFESINDPAVAASLVAAVDEFARANGCELVLGPANPSLNDEAGLLVDGFDSPPMVKMTYNPRWYERLLLECGYAKTIDLYAYIVPADRPVPEKLERVMKRLKAKPGLEVRPLDLKNLARDVRLIKEVYNDAWSENWDYAPMTDAEMEDIARQLKPILRPELCPLVFYKGEPAGICIALPDYNQLLLPLRGRLWPFGFLRLLFGRGAITQCRLWALGLKRKFHNLGFDALLYYESFMGARKLGYTRGEVSWILETNEDIIRPIRVWGGEKYKTYRIYGRPVAGPA